MVLVRWHLGNPRQRKGSSGDKEQAYESTRNIHEDPNVFICAGPRDSDALRVARRDYIRVVERGSPAVGRDYTRGIEQAAVYARRG